MKIGFLLAGTEISGGVNVILEHAGYLAKTRNDVFMIVPGGKKHHDVSWHHIAKTMKWIAADNCSEIEFDILVTTFWVTCYQHDMINARHYVYFNQSVESRFYPGEQQKYLAEATYMLGYHVITEASWIKKYIYDKYAVDAFLVRNGIDKSLFLEKGHCVKKREEGRLRILVEGPLDLDFKNVKKTIELCKKSNADEIWLLTRTEIEEELNIDRVFCRVPINTVGAIYRSCDLIVKLSYIEGMFGPPLEMFHCGGTAIVYDVSGYDEYIVHGYNSLVVPTDNEKLVIDYINKLKEDPSLLQKLKNGASVTAQNWIDWTESSRQFAEVLKDIFNNLQSNKDSVASRIGTVKQLCSSIESNQTYFSNEIARLNQELSQLLNRKAYRITLPIRKITEMMRRILKMKKNTNRGFLKSHKMSKIK